MKSHLVRGMVAILLMVLLAYFALPATRFDLARSVQFGLLWGVVVWAVLFVMLKAIGRLTRSGS